MQKLWKIDTKYFVNNRSIYSTYHNLITNYCFQSDHDMHDKGVYGPISFPFRLDSKYVYINSNDESYANFYN